MIDFRVVSAGFPSLDMIRSSRKRLMNAITQNQEKQICFFIMMILIGHSTYLKVTEGNARYATFPNTVKFQLQEEVLARSATTTETLLASEKPRISHLKFSSSDILPIVIECWMANVPEHGQISAARSGFSKERYNR